MSDLDTAIALACKAHAGQKDKGMQPYILHPLRLMLKLQDEQSRIVAVLHDVVEDSSTTLDDLRKSGFSDEIIDAIACLTKKRGEKYEEFIERISVNRLARQVKIQDIRDNMDLSRLKTVSDEDLRRIAKYHKSINFLLQIENQP